MVETAWGRTLGSSIVDQLAICGMEVWGWGRRLNKGEVAEIRHCQDRLSHLRGMRDDESVREYGVVQEKYLQLVKAQSDK